MPNRWPPRSLFATHTASAIFSRFFSACRRAAELRRHCGEAYIPTTDSYATKWRGGWEIGTGGSGPAAHFFRGKPKLANLLHILSIGIALKFHVLQKGLV